MTVEPGPFEAFYYTPLQHPWLLWAAAALGLAAAFARQGVDPGLRRYLLGLGLLSALDAWLTSSPVPGLGEKTAPWSSLLPLFFVLAGDFRYLLVAAAGTPAGRLAVSPRRLGLALGLTALVPVAAQIVLLTLPAARAEDPRVLFFVYELLFVGLVLFAVRRLANVRAAAWLRALGRYVILYYALWASADALILGGLREPGFALRVVPNLLYYGGLITAIAWLAPARRAPV